MNEADESEFFVHENLINLLVKRICLWNTEKNNFPLLCLDIFQPIRKSQFCETIGESIKIDDLKTGTPYSIILEAIQNFIPSEKSKSEKNEILFKEILDFLSSIGYNPSSECTPDGLVAGNLSHHVALSLLLEWIIIDKSLSIELLCSDLKSLPRSFYVMKDKPAFLLDSVALWLSKVPANPELKDIKKLDEDLINGQHIASVLARAYPQKINKGDIKIGDNLSNEDIEHNWNLIENMAKELNLFIIPRKKLSQQLILIFIADIFYATRPAAKKFVKLDQEPPIELLPMPNQEKPQLTTLQPPPKQYLPAQPINKDEKKEEEENKGHKHKHDDK